MNALPAGPDPHLPGQQRVGGQRPGGGRRPVDAGRGPAPAADPPVDLVPGGAVGPGLRGERGQRARACPASCSATTSTSPGPSPTPRTRPRCSTPSGPASPGPGSTSGTARGGGCAQVHYTIAVRGGAAAQRLTVDLTVHGPIMTQAGQTTSVDWMGNVPSPDLAVLLAHQPGAATGPSSTPRWRTGGRPRRTSSTPTTGATSARSRPGTTRWCRHGEPWLPMPGTGADDVAGVIPYPAVPAGLRPARARAGHREPAPGRAAPTRTTSAPRPTSSTPATGPARSTPRCSGQRGHDRRPASPPCRPA